MAVLRRCCCFDNTRSGSLACGVYSMIYSVVYLGWWMYQYFWLTAVAAISRAYGLNYDAIYAGYFINFVALSLLFVACIFLIVGVSKDNKVLLLPYVILLSVLLFFQVISWIIWLAILGLGALVLIVDFVVWIGFTSLNIVCLLCVISQYQELHEGRGRISDVMAARPAVHRQRVVVINQPVAVPVGLVTTTTYAGNTAVVTAPVQQGYPPAQQGYPPAPQGYPAAQQAYLPPPQGGQQGYPPPPQQQQQQQGYPPAGQIPGQPTDPAPSNSQQDPGQQQQDQSHPTE